MKKNGHEKRRDFIVIIIVAAVVFFVILFIFAACSEKSCSETLRGRNFWMTLLVAYGLLLIGFLMIYRVDAKHIVMGENDLEDASWMDTATMKKLDEFDVGMFSDIPKKSDATTIGAEKKKGGVEILTTTELHTLIVGMSGCGKTSGFVDQNIAALSESRTKPSLIITDPKKELYLRHFKDLELRGYNVVTLDLRSPYTSRRWNPLSVLSTRASESGGLKEEIERLEKNSARGKLTYAEEISLRDLRVRRQKLSDEIYELAKDVVYTLCPIKNKDQASWEMGARDFILGFLLAMCEDVEDGILDADKLLLMNLYENITKYCDEDTEKLKEYLFGRDEFSKVRGLVNTVLVTSDRTLTSYLSDVNSYMQELADDGIQSLTSKSEIDFYSIDERPTAVFIVVPDEKKTRHSFVTLFIAQLYKELTEKCNLNLSGGETEDATLKRRVYFILDEFGNIPKIRDMDSIISVARSRGMRFFLILQSLTQLQNVYGRDAAAVIADNCSVKMFLGSDDAETKRTFSALCGQRKIKSLSVSSSSQNDSPSSQIGAVNKPLISEGELQLLNGAEKGEAVVCVRGFRPIRSRFTPSYMLWETYFPNRQSDAGKAEAAEYFDKKAFFCDMTSLTELRREKTTVAKPEDFIKESESVIDEEERAREGAAPDVWSFAEYAEDTPEEDYLPSDREDEEAERRRYAT
ncbi:MAG: type IV secretory system conjugative DNA transfer family protein [Clostridia bacterium]|nr:type IV secretory system conjugative DNA transfer family protein [Clostridia bacterium]